MLTYVEWVAKYGDRPADIVYAMCQKEAEEAVIAERKAIGEWIMSRQWEAITRGVAKFCLCSRDIAALRRGERPGVNHG